jgi:cytochrome c2
MNYSKLILALLTVGLLSMGSVGIAFGEDDDDERGERGEESERGGWMESRAPLAPVVNATYTQECGSCHMAYQPGLLPPQAWAQIMAPAALANHYGDDASLTDDLRTEISTYLGANATDLALQRNPHRVSPGGSTPSQALPRITATTDFKRQHDEIPARLGTGNPEVGSFSKCEACHRGAAEGDYNERQISIPGHGRWED